MYALAVPRFAVAMPPNARAANSQRTLCPHVRPPPSPAIASAVPAIDQTSTGLRPTRSERRPQTGTKKNCISE
jgi:hypothetical protein